MVRRDGKARIEIRANHNPAHFHVTSPDSDFMVDLTSFAVIRGRGSAAELAGAVTWASKLQLSPNARLWQDQAVLGREGGERHFNNPTRRFYQSTLVPSSNPEIKLVTLPPTESAAPPD